MIFKKTTLTLLVLIGAFTANAQATPKHFDFGYNVAGDSAVIPDQVFDDGVNTFLQFPEEAKVPAIFAVTDKGDQLVKFKVDGPYVVVLGVAKRLKTQSGAQTATIEYQGATASSAAEKPAAAAPAKPMAKTEANLNELGKVADLKGVAFPLNFVEVTVPAQPVATVVTEEAKADVQAVAVEKEKVVVKAELSPAVEPMKLNSVATVQPALPALPLKPLPAWSAVPGTTLRGTVERWANEAESRVGAGWSVKWDAELLDYPIEAPFSMMGEFQEVIGKLFEAYAQAPRPFLVDIYPTQHLVVVKEKR